MATSSEKQQQQYAKLRLAKLIQKAASQLVAQEDVWAQYNIPAIPAERVVRHMYNPVTQSWETDETIVKIEPKPFTHGAMRHCFRLKKMATLPQQCSNHRFHAQGWSRSSNYVAKAYVVPTKNKEDDGSGGGDGGGELVIDSSNEAKAAVLNDVLLQYEAMHWAQKFNNLHPPRSIVFIRAYAMEFPYRQPAPVWFAVERFIAGRDDYGAGFVKHNTNSGFVDPQERRRTPQVFSAFSFYASHGHRLVADIQGVADLYTDPQVHSSDFRFGEGDLGFRGMAMFFKSFRHCEYSDLMGIPIFPLSRNELKFQNKYHDDDLTMSEGDEEDEDEENTNRQHDDFLFEDEYRYQQGRASPGNSRLAKERQSLLRLENNRMRRRSMLKSPANVMELVVGGGELDGEISNIKNQHPESNDTLPTAKRSNLSHSMIQLVTTNNAAAAAINKDVRRSVRLSMKSSCHTKTLGKKKSFHRTQSDVEEVTFSLQHAMRDTIFDHKMFHRKASGELRERTSETHKDDFRTDVTPAPPMIPNDETKANLGKVHYHLACLHGLNRFPEMMEKVLEQEPKAEGGDDDNSSNSNSSKHKGGMNDSPGPDAASIVFHLSHAASLRCPAACLALGRVRAGLKSCVSTILQDVVPVDFDSAKELLHRAMATTKAPMENDNARDGGAGVVATAKRGLGPDVKTRAAAGCLLLQILQEEEETTPATLQNLLEEALVLVQQAHKEQEEMDAQMERLKSHNDDDNGGGNACVETIQQQQLKVGDRVEGNYCMEGTFYPGVVTELHDSGDRTGCGTVMVQYDDDGSRERLSRDAVRLLTMSSSVAAVVAAATTSRRRQSTSAPFTTVDAEGQDVVLLDDLEALGLINEDENCLLDVFTLQADLAKLKAQLGHTKEAADLYEAATEGAFAAGKMQTASEYSLQAAELSAGGE
ncbi:hypothetical protein ACA910_006434 [Epithemia clementina (nom. ined.)]